jgi:predicted Zn finger-like uncharacterized protein
MSTASPTTNIQERGLVECPACQTRFAIPMDQLVGVSQPKFHCSHCDNLFTVGAHQIQPLQIISNNAIPSRKERLANASRTLAGDLTDSNSERTGADVSLDEFLEQADGNSNFTDSNSTGADRSGTSQNELENQSNQTAPRRPYEKTPPWRNVSNDSNSSSANTAWSSSIQQHDSIRRSSVLGGLPRTEMSKTQREQRVEAFEGENFLTNGGAALKPSPSSINSYNDEAGQNPLEQNWGHKTSANQAPNSKTEFTLGDLSSETAWGLLDKQQSDRSQVSGLQPQTSSRLSALRSELSSGKWTIGKLLPANFVERASKKADVFASTVQKTASNLLVKKDTSQQALGDLFDRAAERKASSQASNQPVANGSNQEWQSSEFKPILRFPAFLLGVVAIKTPSPKCSLS